MSLLEDARRLATRGFTPWEDSCHLTCELCGADGAGEDGPFPHEVVCPWLAMSKIVAALEAIDGLMVSDDGAEPIEGDEWAFCRRPAGGPHWEGCLWVKAVDLVYRDGP